MFRRLVPVCLVAVLAACGGIDPATPVAAPATTTEPAAPTTASPVSDTDSEATSGSTPAVPAALQFSAPLVGGGDIELGALAGRPVLLWFWAPW